MFCKKCGIEIFEGATVCPNCGTTINTGTESQKAVLKKEEENGSAENIPTENISAENVDEMQIDPEKSSELEENDTIVLSEEAENTEKEIQPEDILEFSDSLLKSGVTSYDDPISPEPPKKKGKGPIIAVCTLAGVLVILVLYLTVSLFTKDNIGNYVKKAFENTTKSLVKVNNLTSAKILLSDVYSQNINLTLKSLEIEEYGRYIDLGELENSRISMGGTIDNKNNTVLANLGLGFGDMNNIQMELYFDKKDFYFGFPNLYDKFFMVTDEDLDINTENIIEQQEAQEAVKSLVEALSGEILKRYKDIQFVKTNKVTLQGNTDIKTQEVMMYMKGKDYNEFLDALPEIIENNTTFLDWMISISSEYEKEDFIEELKQLTKELRVDTAENVNICYLYIDEKQKQIVGIRLPLDSVEEEQGDIIFYLLGTDQLTDYIEFTIDVTSDGYNDTFSYINKKYGNDYETVFLLEQDGEEILRTTANGNTIDNGDSFVININELSLNYNDGYTSAAMILEGSYEIRKEDVLTIPSENSVKLLEMSDIEIQETILTILQNMLDGNYIPSAYRADLQALIISLKEKANIDSDLDGSDNLTYDEFKQVIKEVYGDMYTEEELKELYEMLYGEDSMSDYEGDDTGNNGPEFNGENVVLTDFDNQYSIEIIPPEGAELETDWLSSNRAYFQKGNLEYYYMISSEESDMKDYYESIREYYEDIEDVKINIFELKTKKINGYDVQYTILNMEYVGLEKYSECVAYVKIDEEYIFLVQITNGDGEFDEKILEDCFNSKIPVQ